MKDALQYANHHQASHLEELIAFLKIPSVSTEPVHAPDVRAAAAWLAEKMGSAGLQNVQVIDDSGHPLVYADWLHAGPAAPTVLIYGHYDVQPAEQLELWESDPFDPQIRDEFIYARGASDDKGQVYVHIKAVESYLKSSGQLPVNVKFILEGEEESGGKHLSAFIPQNKELLAADVALISDTAMFSPQLPAIVYGLRGIVYTFLDVAGPAVDLHSGSYGGAINNPLNALGQIIAGLKDKDGHILIPGFYDKVRPLSAADREIMGAAPFDEEEWLAITGAPQSWGEAEFTIPERLGARPTLDVHGIIGGYTGAGRKTVLPANAHAKVSMRLVPDQDPQEIAELFTKYVQSITPPSVTAAVTICGTSAPSINELQSPAMGAAAHALKDVFGNEPVFLREGGSIPVVNEFQEILGMQTVMMGFGLPGDRIHSPNERFYLPNYYRGIQAGIRFLSQYETLFAEAAV